MKRKLNIILSLITFSLIGIIIFQAVYLNGIYKEAKEKFKQELRPALIEATDEFLVNIADSLANDLEKQLNNSSIRLSHIGKKENGKFIVQLTNGRLKSDSLKVFNLTDSLSTSGSVLSDQIKWDLKAFRWMFEDKFINGPELKVDSTANTTRGIRALSDTGKKIWETSIVFPVENFLSKKRSQLNRKKEHLQIYPSYYLKTKKDRLYEMCKAQLVGKDLYTPFQLQWVTEVEASTKMAKGYEVVFLYQSKFANMPVKGKDLAAIFQKPNVEAQAALSNISGVLIASLFLIGITVCCFILMYRLILSQKRLAEMKDDFINNMTHELKTPIATISAAVEGMQNFNALEDKEKTERYLETSRKELRRLDSLVTKVLNMASFEKKEIELSIGNVNLDEMINDIIDAEKLKAGKETTFNFERQKASPQIQVDATHFRNSIANIIDNAVKYSGNPASINIISGENAGTIFITIKDNGLGISADQQDRIFEKFYRVPSGNLHAVKGTGLGLSYSKFIIEKHGGTITVESDSDKGSEFIISLPKK